MSEVPRGRLKEGVIAGARLLLRFRQLSRVSPAIYLYMYLHDTYTHIRIVHIHHLAATQLAHRLAAWQLYGDRT